MFNTIFSLSTLSIFILPFMFSFTTNFNFVWFWLTWSTFVFSFSPTRVEILGTTMVRVLFYALPSTLMFLFDMLLPAASTVFKARGAEGLPGGRKTRNLRLREFKVAGWSLFNIALGIILQGSIELIFHHTLGWKARIKVSSILPFPGTIAKHLIIGLSLRGVSEIDAQPNIITLTDSVPLYRFYRMCCTASHSTAKSLGTSPHYMKAGTTVSGFHTRSQRTTTTHSPT
jgi:hypothetical protein